jgi:Holliday junction resolvase RusA-like endonuclease
MGNFIIYKKVMKSWIRLNIAPIAKPRMTRSDKWRKKNHKNPKYEIRACVETYYAFKDKIKKESKGFNLGDSYSILFCVPYPKSYSKKKKRELFLKPHKQRPDLDNFLKAINDSFCKEDSHIYKIKAKKIWSYKPYIIIINN